MANDRMVGMVQTVQGPIRPEQLGVTHTHEHILSDASGLLIAPKEASAKDLYCRPLSADTAGYIRHYADTVANSDDMSNGDVSVAIEEVGLFKQCGGDSPVDATPIGLGRDPVALARVSRATGVNIVMGAAYYVYKAHPPDMDSRSEDDLADQIVRDVTEGVDGTGIKSGVIGEVGCSWPLRDNELKVLRAAGRAQRLTGAPILIHPGRNETAPLHHLETLSQVGADLDHTITGHIERALFTKSDLRRVAETGCYIEWDLIGEERSFYGGPGTAPDVIVNIDMPDDATRIDQFAWLASEGYEDKIVVAHDIAFKHRLVRHGGHGFSYVLAHIVPRMRAGGFSEELIHKILVDNPKAALTFSKPQQA